MKHLIRKCPNCCAYTLKRECDSCKVQTIDPHPPKYSPDDKYARYRIEDRYKVGWPSFERIRYPSKEPLFSQGEQNQPDKLFELLGRAICSILLA